MSKSTSSARRQFLKFLAASPYVAALGGVAAFLRQAPSPRTRRNPRTSSRTPPTPSTFSISRRPRTARCSPAIGHTWRVASTTTARCAPIAKGSSTSSCVRAACATPPKSTCTSICSAPPTTARSSLCPTGGEKSFYPDGELAVARAAKARGTLQFLSTATSTPVEDVNKALGRPVWYQLYAPSTWDACEKILRRVEAAGCSVIALTVDNTTGRNSETYLRTRPKDLSQCAACHEGEPATTSSSRSARCTTAST